ncbi:MAG: symmetrical bis(5'-nucleosyl)-tetraphosphatase [Halioglobus sp.]
MSIYAVGDIQGCLKPLQCLLESVGFDPAKDTLWSVGDSVNRGPLCLETLRFLHGMKNSLVMVLGNHDLHLLAVAAGVRTASPSDTLDKILAAEDCDELIEWLAGLPLLHHEHGHTLVHAGIAPQWSLTQAQALASEVEAALRGSTRNEFLANMYGNQPAIWSDELTGTDRLRVITNYFTRMRFCSREGELDLKNKGGIEPALAGQSNGMQPWFSHVNRKMAGQPIVFGHWAALEGNTGRDDAIGLDTGCVWDAAMTLYNIETRERWACHCEAGDVNTSTPP